MSNAIISAISMYAENAVLEPYIHSKAAVLANPEVFEYSLYGEETRIREVRGGNASTYSAGQGFRNGGKGGSVTWLPYKAPFDREITFPVPAIDELNSINNNMTLSGILLSKQYWANFGGEIDATTFSTITNATLPANVLANATLPTDAENIIGTLNTIKNKLFNNGYAGKAFVFVSSTAYANFLTALSNKNALANDSVIRVNPSLDGELEVTLDVTKFDNLYLVRVPDNRLVSHVTLLDGHTAGQTDGGWAPDTTNPDFSHIDLLVVPKEAAALSIRHLVTSMTVPARFKQLVDNTVGQSLTDINNIYNGAVTVDNIGIDQTGDQFKYMNRIIYGTAVFDTWKKTLIAVKSA